MEIKARSQSEQDREKEKCKQKLNKIELRRHETHQQIPLNFAWECHGKENHSSVNGKRIARENNIIWGSDAKNNENNENQLSSISRKVKYSRMKGCESRDSNSFVIRAKHDSAQGSKCHNLESKNQTRRNTSSRTDAMNKTNNYTQNAEETCMFTRRKENLNQNHKVNPFFFVSQELANKDFGISEYAEKYQYHKKYCDRQENDQSLTVAQKEKEIKQGTKKKSSQSFPTGIDFVIVGKNKCNRLSRDEAIGRSEGNGIVDQIIVEDICNDESEIVSNKCSISDSNSKNDDSMKLSKLT